MEDEFPSEMEIDDGIGEDLDVITYSEIPIRRVIDGVKNEQENFDSILILGWRKDGSLYAACNGARKADVLWLLETAKRKLFTDW